MTKNGRKQIDKQKIVTPKQSLVFFQGKPTLGPIHLRRVSSVSGENITLSDAMSGKDGEIPQKKFRRSKHVPSLRKTNKLMDVHKKQ